MPSDFTGDEPNPPPLPRYSDDSKVAATLHDRPDCTCLRDGEGRIVSPRHDCPRADCECDGYPGHRVCGCWQRREDT